VIARGIERVISPDETEMTPDQIRRLTRELLGLIPEKTEGKK